MFHCSLLFSRDKTFFHKVFLMQQAFHKFEDQLRSIDIEERKRNRICDSEAGHEAWGNGDPYTPYNSISGENGGGPWNEDSFNNSNLALPLVSNATPFQWPNLYEDNFENKLAHSENSTVEVDSQVLMMRRWIPACKLIHSHCHVCFMVSRAVCIVSCLLGSGLMFSFWLKAQWQ